jgi:hypothetical protein
VRYVSKTSNQSEVDAVCEMNLDELEIVSGGDSKAPKAPTLEYGALHVQYVR